MSLFIIIPTYNEAENIERLLNEIHTNVDAQIIVVDDCSPDGTGGLVKRLAEHDRRIHLLQREQKGGIGSAYIAGFKEALRLQAKIIVQMDADFSHAPADVKKLLNAGGADLVLGSRYIKGGKIIGWGPWRHFCSRAAISAARNYLSLPAKDITSGFRLWKADLLKHILDEPLHSSGYAFQEEMLFHAARRGATIQEVPITFQDRRLGRSKLGYRDVMEFFSVMQKLKKHYDKK